LIDFGLHGPPVDLQPSCSLFVAASLRVDESAVAAQQIVRRERTFERFAEYVPARFGLRESRGAVLIANQNVADTLLEFAIISRPFVEWIETGIDPLHCLLREGFGVSTCHAPRHK